MDVCNLVQFVAIFVSILGTTLQIHAMPVADLDTNARLEKRQPQTFIQHQQVCQKAVSVISRNPKISKRDDTFLNLVINVCLPDVTPNSLIKLLQEISDITNLNSGTGTSATTTESGTTTGSATTTVSDATTTSGSATTTEAGWDAGLLEETGPGQEGEDNPGGTPDWSDADDWWTGEFADADVQEDGNGDEAPSWKRDKKFWDLITNIVGQLSGGKVYTDGGSSDEGEDDATTTSSPLTTTDELSFGKGNLWDRIPELVAILSQLINDQEDSTGFTTTDFATTTGSATTTDFATTTDYATTTDEGTTTTSATSGDKDLWDLVADLLGALGNDEDNDAATTTSLPSTTDQTTTASATTTQGFSTTQEYTTTDEATTTSATTTTQQSSRKDTNLEVLSREVKLEILRRLLHKMNSGS